MQHARTAHTTFQCVPRGGSGWSNLHGGVRGIPACWKKSEDTNLQPMALADPRNSTATQIIGIYKLYPDLVQSLGVFFANAEVERTIRT